ncbi:DUF5518 domain-containing protein [Haladaptatus sp. CMAA 1911]|uniref:DUF5518 domain-containing protein n=1 Tax=unclassified Haladaptatus TaxID=2622732 RepID=UPI003754ED50
MVAGLTGGVIVGYLSTDGVKSCSWHGLLAGTIDGLGTIVTTVVLASLSFCEERIPPVTALTRRVASRSHTRTRSVLGTGVDPTTQR